MPLVIHLSSQSHTLLTTPKPPEDCSTYLQLLQTFILKNALSQGKEVHSFIVHRGFAFATRKPFHNKLIFMYVKCGSLVDARKVFDQMKERDIISWNTIITAYRRHGYPQEAVTLFHHMQQTGLQPDQFTLPTYCQPVKADNVDNRKILEKPAQTIDSQESEIPTQTEQLAELEKPIEDKGTNTGPLKTKKLAVELSKKQTDAEVHVETKKLAVIETLKQFERPLKVEVQTQKDPPEENKSKMDTSDGNKEDIVKVIG
ncbi:pentatricopeptide repeat-containing protein CRR2, chloroplastic-like [Cryptomeria japonica]|uniref:pentatricopeptide repeat-containing protein CRR2, chloroplastic-like n=1 Tax=Cryptomeria japonica TaxID=3369 RepID=UPI0027D9D5BD|nr:pentatricopeptide repeat-containing protein CRR2, chloroplastic-like [Cryptomeria japonica]